MQDKVQYFLGIDGEQVGPLSKEEVLQKIYLKEVQETDMIWWEGEEEWFALWETDLYKKRETFWEEMKPEPAPEPKVEPIRALEPLEEKAPERKHPKIGGDVESVLSGMSSIENHPTFSRDNKLEPVFKMSKVPHRSTEDYLFRLLVVVVVLAVAGALFYIKFSSVEAPSAKEPTQKIKARLSVSELQNLIKKDPNDAVAKQAIEQLTSFYRTNQRYGEAGRLMLQINRPDEAVKYFSLDPSLSAENEKASWEAYNRAEGEERKKYLLLNIKLLLDPLKNLPRAVERIKMFESEFPKSSHPYGYYLKGTDEKISDLFSRTSFYFVQNLISYLNSELPQLKLAGRPLVEIKKSKAQMYKIVGSYKGEVTLNRDKLKGVFFDFWFANESWHIVDTNLTKERQTDALKERAKLSSISVSGEVLLQYMENVFRAQFPRVALHEVVDLKK